MQTCAFLGPGGARGFPGNGGVRRACRRAGAALEACVDTRMQPGPRCPLPSGTTAVTWGLLILSSQTAEVAVETADHR